MTTPAPAPVAAVADDVLDDLLLVADGLLDARDCDLAGRVAAPGVGRGEGDRDARRVRLPLAPDLAGAAAGAGTLLVVDGEGVPVVRLDDVVADDGGVTGTAHPTTAPGNGAGHALRLPFAPAAPDAPAAGGREVVLLTRPLLDADEAALHRRVRAGADVVIVVPVAGPSPDGLPPHLLLRAAARAAARTGARQVAATLRRRDQRSDAHLLAHVAAGLGTDAVVTDLPGAGDWSALLGDHRAERPVAARGPVAEEVLADLARWWPPRSRRGLVVLMTGLSGSGKSTLARALAEHVEDRAGRTVSLLDGDHVRRMLSSGLGFGRADRELNVLRIGYVATEVARHGGVAVCAPIAPYASTRAAVRRMVEQVGDLVLVHVSTPLAECERRDVKGLYARARAGQIPAFTGISDPYEEPEDADVVVDTSRLTVQEALDRVVAHLVDGGRLVEDGGR